MKVIAYFIGEFCTGAEIVSDQEAVERVMPKFSFGPKPPLGYNHYEIQYFVGDDRVPTRKIWG